MKVSLRTLLIIAILILFVGIGGLFFFFQSQNTSSPNQNVGGNFFGNLFPFLPGNNGDSNLNGQNTLVDDSREDREVPILRQISDVPVSGAYIYGDDQILIRYIERSTGHIFETEANGFNTDRISNTTIPGINEALWFDENNLAVRYLSDNEIETFIIELEPELTEQSVNGLFVDSWNRAFYDKASGELFSVFETSSGSYLTIGGPEEDGRVVLNSPISSWVPIQTEKTLYIQTAPNYEIEGSLFKIISGRISKVLSGARGMMSNINPNDSWIALSAGGVNSLSLSLINLNEDVPFFKPSIKTISSKCAWINDENLICGVPRVIPEGVYPDDWLLGQTSFDDSFWLLDSKSQTSDEILDPEKNNTEPIDVWQPMVDETGSYMIFINKRDLTLWSLRLKDEVAENTDAN